MITLNHLVRKEADASADEFRNFWMTEHAQASLGVSEKLGIRQYTKSETMHEDEVNQLLQQIYGTKSDAYDFVDQMVINDLEDFKKGLMDGEVRETLTSIHAMESRWVDHSWSDYWFSVDVPQVFTAESCVATWSNTLLKSALDMSLDKTDPSSDRSRGLPRRARRPGSSRN